jgi:hypothetical protein
MNDYDSASAVAFNSGLAYLNTDHNCKEQFLTSNQAIGTVLVHVVIRVKS